MGNRNKRIKELTELFNTKAPIARLFGMKLSFTEAGNAVIDLPYNPELDHALGGIHGGVYATMLDNAGWFAAAAAHEFSCWVATSEMSLHLLKSVKKTALRSVGNLIKKAKRQSIAEMHLYDSQGELVGHATGTFIILAKIPFS
jgi:uncharacterized protein (TIGR00369 family)